MSEKADQLAEKLKDIKDPKTQNLVFSTLFSRIGAGHEDNETGSERIISPDLDASWAAANEHLERIAEKSLQDAFDAAITLSTIEVSGDSEQEGKNKWIRGTGLGFIGADRVQGMLSDYLENGEKKDILTETLINNIKDIDAGKFKEYDDFYAPEGFLVVQSTYIGLGLKDAEGDNAKKIYAAAREKADLPETKVAAKALSQVPGCEYVTVRI